MGRLLDEILKKYREVGRIEAVDFEVTHRCPCNCMHCCLDHTQTDELDLSEIASLFGQLREEGVLELGITGGEPLIRQDFFQILALAHKERFLISLLTSGVLIGPAEIARLKDTGVKHVEISLLGATAVTNDMIMGHAGAFDKIVRATRLLVKAKIPVTLKTTVLQLNYTELDEMARLAKKLHADFDACCLITPRDNGNAAPQRLMLNERQLAQIDRKYLGVPLVDHDEKLSGAVLTCQAGKTVAAVDPSGNVLPCILFPRNVGNIRSRTFRNIWTDDPDPFLRELRGLKDTDIKVCYRCEQKEECQRCPGTAYLETGELRQPSGAACFLAGQKTSSQGLRE